MKGLVQKLVVVSIGCVGMSQFSAAGVVFTINNTDRHTGESIGSMEVIVEGPLLKMKNLDSRSQSQTGSMSDAAIDAASESAGSLSGGYAGAGATADNDDDGDMIFNAEKREVIVVDAKNKEYFVTDEATLTRIRGQFGGSPQGQNPMNDMLKQAYEQARANLDAQGLSPQERAAAEQMLRSTMGISEDTLSGGASAPEMIRGERETINGYPAIWYERAGRGRVAMADWDDLGPGAEAQETMETFFEFLAAMSQGGMAPDSGFMDAVGEIGGFPVAGNSAESMSDEDWVLESVEKRDLDPDAFEPPAGYRLRTMGGFFQ